MRRLRSGLSNKIPEITLTFKGGQNSQPLGNKRYKHEQSSDQQTRVDFSTGLKKNGKKPKSTLGQRHAGGLPC